MLCHKNRKKSLGDLSCYFKRRHEFPTVCSESRGPSHHFNENSFGVLGKGPLSDSSTICGHRWLCCKTYRDQPSYYQKKWSFISDIISNKYKKISLKVKTALSFWSVFRSALITITRNYTFVVWRKLRLEASYDWRPHITYHRRYSSIACNEQKQCTTTLPDSCMLMLIKNWPQAAHIKKSANTEKGRHRITRESNTL